MTARTCATCAHRYLVQIMPEVDRLECRFAPPGINGFAQTKPENWCGQHREETAPAPSILMPSPTPKLFAPSTPALTTRKGGKR